MREAAEPMRRAVARALLLVGVLAAEDRPVFGQARGESAAPLAAGADATPLPGARSSGREGRRDPFVNPLLGSGPPAASVRPRGLAGIAVGELALRGLVLVAGAYVAVLESENGRSHLLRGGERLFDGSVRSVTAEGVVIDRHGPHGPSGVGARAVRLTLTARTDRQP